MTAGFVLGTVVLNAGTEDQMRRGKQLNDRRVEFEGPAGSSALEQPTGWFFGTKYTYVCMYVFIHFADIKDVQHNWQLITQIILC